MESESTIAANLFIYNRTLGKRGHYLIGFNNIAAAIDGMEAPMRAKDIEVETKRTLGDDSRHTKVRLVYNDNVYLDTPPPGSRREKLILPLWDEVWKVDKGPFDKQLGCTCGKSALAWHAIRAKCRRPPSPYIQAEPTCDWCNTLSRWPYKIFPNFYRAAANVTITIITISPNLVKLNYNLYNNELQLAEPLLHRDVPGLEHIVHSAILGEPVDKDLATIALSLLRKSKNYMAEELVKDYIANRSNTILHASHMGFWIMVAALECAIWWPSDNRSTYCIRHPYAPGFRGIVGHFIVPNSLAHLWELELYPLGVEYIQSHQLGELLSSKRHKVSQ